MCTWHSTPKSIFLSRHIFRGSNLYYIELFTLNWHILLAMSLSFGTFAFSYLSFAKAKTNMFPWVSCVLSLRLKGKWSIRQRHRFHSTPLVLSILCRYSAISQNWYNFSLVFTCTNGGESKKGLYRLHFWRFMPKGERVLAQSKRTAPPCQFQKKSR
jgi:hypothetical protein